MPIPDIRLNDLNIRDVKIPDVPKWMSTDPPIAVPIFPPVTTEIGTPIVNIPGCVEAHKDNQENVNLKEEDDKGVGRDVQFPSTQPPSTHTQTQATGRPRAICGQRYPLPCFE